MVKSWSPWGAFFFRGAGGGGVPPYSPQTFWPAAGGKCFWGEKFWGFLGLFCVLFDSWSLWFTVKKTPHKHFVNIKLFFFFRREKCFFLANQSKKLSCSLEFYCVFQKTWPKKGNKQTKSVDKMRLYLSKKVFFFFFWGGGCFWCKGTNDFMW